MHAILTLCTFAGPLRELFTDALRSVNNLYMRVGLHMSALVY